MGQVEAARRASLPSRPEQGIVKLRVTTLNQDDEALQVYVANVVVQRRG